MIEQLRITEPKATPEPELSRLANRIVEETAFAAHLAEELRCLSNRMLGPFVSANSLGERTPGPGVIGQLDAHLDELHSAHLAIVEVVARLGRVS